MAQINPAFEVEKLEGTRKHVVLTPNKKDGGFDRKEIEIDNGYFVYFPRGHSIRVSADKLKELGFDRAPGLVDMDSGESLPSQPSLKEMSARRTKPSRETRGE